MPRTYGRNPHGIYRKRFLFGVPVAARRRQQLIESTVPAVASDGRSLRRSRVAAVVTYFKLMGFWDMVPPGFD